MTGTAVSGRVVELTDPYPTYEQNADEWRRDVSVKDFITRELELEKILPCRYWGVYVDDELVAHCRNCKREAIVEGERKIEACIGNVFTVEKHRKKGHAATLLTHVTKVLSEECDIVTLWSDVGSYYARFGYKMIENVSALKLNAENMSWPEEVDTVTSQNLDEAIDRHKHSLKLGGDEIALEPTRQAYENWMQTAVLNSEIFGITLPDIWGAMNASGWCLWSYDLGRSKNLTILAIDGDITPLIKAAHAAASLLGLSTIEIYKESVVSQTSKKQFEKIGVFEKRECSLPMYISKYDWVHPGKYAWF